LLLGCLWVGVCVAEDPLGLALRELRMTTADLGFKKDVAESEFVTATARQSLAQPLTLLDRARLQRFNSLAELADWSRQQLELPATNITAAAAPRLALPPAIQRIYDAAVAVQPLLPKREESAWEAFALENFRTKADRLAFAPKLAGRDEALELQDDEAARALLDAGARVDRVALLAAFRCLCAAVDAALVELRGQKLIPLHTDTPLGPIIIGGAGNDTYTNAALVIIDPGGDDHYAVSNPLPVSIIIDLAGNDTYDGPVGSGVFGIGLLLDWAGNDTYRAQHVAQGVGVFGCGLLADFGGRDTFTADTFAQGAGEFGVGILWQRGGSTQYRLAGSGQGYGGVGGVGLLLDESGNDSYYAGGKYPCRWLDGHYFSLAQGMGMGLRPFAGGGTGILCDRAGRDHYEADVYGQGASYWYSVGLLLDESGNDSYQAYQYCQGAGIHLSSGLLADLAGNDRYTAHAICQGGAHDYSVGLLVDDTGNDRYTADSTAQGGAINNSFAMLLDRRGDDRYTGTDPKQSQASGHNGGRREYGSIAVLLDLGGADGYSQGHHNNALWTKPNYGAGLDAEWGGGAVGKWEARPVGAASPPRLVCRPVDVHHPIERLVRRATRDWETDDEKRDAEIADKELKQRAVEVLPYLLTRLDSPSVMLRVKAEELVDLLGSNAVPLLVTGLQTAANDEVARGCGAMLARFEWATNAIPALLPLLDREKTRAAALYTLGHLRAREAFAPATAALRDERELVRLRAVQALGRIGDVRAIPFLEPLRRDARFYVRFAAEEAIANLKKGK
jgi:hypothetical protein